MRSLKVVILSRDSRHIGGVVYYTNLLIRKLAGEVHFERFIIGKKVDRGNSVFQVFSTLLNCVKLFFKSFTSNIDVFHLNPSLTVNSVLRDGVFLCVLWLAGVKSILILFHGWNAGLAERIKRYYILRLLFRKVYSNASVILVLASEFRKCLMDMGFDGSKIQVTTTMFDGDIVPRGEGCNESSSTVILFLSRLVKEKGVYEMLKGFELASGTFGNVQLYVAGDGPEKVGMEKWVSDHGLNDKVTFTGYVESKEKGQVLLNSDIFVFPTYHGEGCPIALLEAMAGGLAIVTTAVGSIPEIIEDNENGIILPDVTPEEISRGVCQFLSDKDFCAKVQANNKRKAWNNYEAGIVASKIEEIYWDVAGEENPG